MSKPPIDHDLPDLLMVFDSFEESSEFYTLSITRPDGISIRFSFSKYEKKVYLYIRVSPDTKIFFAGASMMNCDRIRVLDIKRKHVEVISGDSETPATRWFIELDEGGGLTIDTG